jgi:hypothetical protein
MDSKDKPKKKETTPKGKSAAKAKPPAGVKMRFLAHTGSLRSFASDEDVTNANPQTVMQRVNLACDDDTGVFFLRSNGRLFMRFVPKTSQ